MLMGDMIGDLRMADGMKAKEHVITVGFLNTKVRSMNFAVHRFIDTVDVCRLKSLFPVIVTVSISF